MTIKRQLYASALISCAAVAITLVTLLLSAREIDLALQKSSFASDITTRGITGLRSVTVDYLVTQQQRALTQWQQRQASLQTLLTTPLFRGSDEQAIVDRMARRNDYLAEIFPRIVSLHGERQDGPAQDRLQRDVEARLVTQIMVTTHEMVADSADLMRGSQAHLQQLQRRSSLIASFLVTLLGLLIVANVLLSIRNILRPLHALRTGTEIVGAGHLEYRTGMTQADEIGALSRSFDAMTERLANAQSEVQAKTARLEEIVRELESFSYSVSHDLRAPLRGIDGWSLALLEDYGAGLDPTAREYLATVRAEAQRMGELIDELLQLSHVTRGELRREPVDISALAQRVADHLKQANPTRAIEFVIEPGLRANADPHLLEIALTNLLDNACKFTGKRPAAKIEVGSTVQRDAQTRRQRKVFFVRDNGVGFDMAHAGKLFGAFQRLHAASEFPGSGIGLATAQRVVLRHGGRIWAQAQAGQGADFYFTLEEAS